MEALQYNRSCDDVVFDGKIIIAIVSAHDIRFVCVLLQSTFSLDFTCILLVLYYAPEAPRVISGKLYRGSSVTNNITNECSS